MYDRAFEQTYRKRLIKIQANCRKFVTLMKYKAHLSRQKLQDEVRPRKYFTHEES